MFRWAWLLILTASVGCDAGGGGGDSSGGVKQPSTLPAPWIPRSDTQFSASVTSSDAAGNRVFALTTDTFGGLMESVVSEYPGPLYVKPKEMLDWTLTVEVKGKNRDEVLKDVADKCKLTLGKTAGGDVLLTSPGYDASPEHQVKIEEDPADREETE